MPSAANNNENNNTDVDKDSPIDEVRSELLQAVSRHLGSSLLESHLEPGVDLWIRVNPTAWVDTAEYLANAIGFGFFDFLSAIDWLPSPFGRSMESDVDIRLGKTDLPSDSYDGTIETGLAGGDTRFQVLYRVYNLEHNVGINIKADLDDTLAVDSIVEHYAGAAWHERECFEMFGINFIGHDNLRKIYLPTGFEGNPLRKDYPLLARLVKPWPGIVDVEGMPETDSGEKPNAASADGAPSTQNPSTQNPEAS